MNDKALVKFTKAILDLMFYAGILCCISLPFLLKWLGGSSMPFFKTNYWSSLILFFLSGVFSVAIIRELRKMFETVIKEDCFVNSNIRSLKRMGYYSFAIAVMTAARLIFIVTPATIVVICVFAIAGLFSRVLAEVFKQAVKYKLENDLTI